MSFVEQDPAFRVPFEGLGLDPNERKVNINAFAGTVIAEQITANRRLVLGGTIESAPPASGGVQIAPLTGTLSPISVDFPADYGAHSYQKLFVAVPGEVSLSLSWQPTDILYAYVYRPGYSAQPRNLVFERLSTDPESPPDNTLGIIAFDESDSNPKILNFTAPVAGEYTIRLYHAIQMPYPGMITLTGTLNPNDDIYRTIPMDLADATRMRVDVSWDVPATDIDIYLYGTPPDEDQIGAAETLANPETINADITGVDPKVGNYTLELYHFDGPSANYTAVAHFGNNVACTYTITGTIASTSGSIALTGTIDASTLNIVSKKDNSGMWISDSKAALNSLMIEPGIDGGIELKVYRGDPFHITATGRRGFARKVGSGYAIGAEDPITLEAWSNGANPQYSLHLQPSNSDFMWFRSEDRALGVTDDFGPIGERFKRAPAGFQTFDDHPMTDTDPVYMFNNVVDMAMYHYAPHLHKVAGCSDHPGWNGLLEYRDRLLTTGVNYTSTIGNTAKSDIWPTIKELDAPVALGNDPIRVYGPAAASNVDMEYIGFLGAYIIYDNSGLYPFGAIIRISGVVEAAANGIPNEVINNYWVVVGAASYYILVIPFAPGPIGMGPFTSGYITVARIKYECMAYRVFHPSHGFTEDMYESIRSPMLEFAGSTAIGPLPASVFNRQCVIAVITSANTYWVMFPPGTSRANDIQSSTPGSINGGGAGVTVSRWIKPYEPLSLGYYSTIAPFYRVSPFTTLFTDTYNGHHGGSLVTVSGLLGAYSSMNGTWSTSSLFPLQESRDKAASYLPSHYNMSSLRYPIPIEFDSSSFPVYDPGTHGVATVSITYGPVKPTTEYGQLVAASIEFMNQLGSQTHCTFHYLISIRDNLSMSTWEDLRESIEMGLQITDFSNCRDRDLSTGQDQYIEVGGRSFGANSPLFINDLPSAAKNNPGPGQINQSLRYDSSDPKWAYPISVENYLDKTTLKNVAITMDPAGGTLEDNVPGADPYRKHLSEYLTTFGYDYNSIKPNFTTIPFGTSIGDSRIVLSVINGVPGVATYPAQTSGDHNQNQLPRNANFILADPIEASTPLANAASCVGKIVVCKRGSSSFETKIKNAADAGAVGVVVWNNTGTIDVIEMSVGDSTMIPSVMIGKDSGNALTGYLGGSETNPANYTMSTTGLPAYTGTLRLNLPGEAPLMLGGSPNTFYFGQIKPALTPGKKIGYIRMGNTVFEDRLGIIGGSEFGHNPGVDNIWDNARRMWSVVLGTQFGGTALKDMDGIILEVRRNNGGRRYLYQALASTMGEDRPALAWVGNSLYRDNGNTIPYTHEQMDGISPFTYTDLEKFKANRDEGSNIKCSKYAADHPSEVIPSGRKIVLLWSTSAYSGGDLFIHPFRKTFAPHGAIGNGVTTYIVGNGDGRLYGASGGVVPVAYNESSPLKFYPSSQLNNQPTSPFAVRGEVVGYFNREDDNSINTTNQQAYTAPDAGPLSGWVEDDTGFYPARGLLPYPVSRTGPNYAAFNAVIGTPDKDVPATWHDPWLEEAIIRIMI